jgi:hypothetical protein
MKRVYLDHKDFKNMAKGLRGENQYIGDAKAYEVLLKHVRIGNLTCYFSALHVLEAVRYKGSDPTEVDSYCDVVESLTQGKSIVWAQTLEDRELRFFVQNRFGIPQGLSLDSYPYGEYLEAFPGTLETCLGWAKQFKTEWDHKKREVIRPFGKTRIERRLIKKRFPPLTEFTVSPDMLNAIPNEFRGIFTPEIMTELIRGTSQSNNEALLNMMRKAMGIRELLTVWRATCPDLDKMGKAFDESAQQLIDMISYNRSATRVFGGDLHKQAINQGLSEISRMLANRSAKKVYQLFPGSGITKKQLEEALVSVGISAMPSWHVAVSLYYQYTLDSVGSGRRKILESDIRDILHMRCLPYVDFLVTDRYFAELARRVREYKTIVLRNVRELVTALEQSA